MSGDELGSRRKALEDVFFSKRDQELLEKLRMKQGREKQREMLGQLTGTKDVAVLDRILDAGILPETYAALTYIPMISIAWADGVLDSNERKEILKLAEKQGIPKDGPGYKLLEHWLEEKPSPAVLGAWKIYVKTLLPTIDATAQTNMKNEVLRLAKSVASAAGGVLGVGAVSTAEKNLLNEISSVFE